MFALVDCNAFFASCERAFHPGLWGKPVCVLSSNDGIIVALTPEAKALGLHRGDPVFKVQGILDRHHVAVFSGNMMLYAAMSKRVTDIIRQSVACVENYSIDESFCDLRGYEKHFNLEALMRGVGEKIRLWTDIPVSIGIAPSKTLAKVGSKFAKQYPGYRGVCVIDTEEKRRKALSLFELADVWGVGRKGYAKLLALGVKTPLELADKPEAWVHRHFTKPMFQTWLELNGQACVNTEEVLARQSICTSRSFGEMISDKEALRSAVAHFAASCANTLRGQGSVAGCVSVFIGSNHFRQDLRQYWNGASRRLAVDSADTVEITEVAMSLLDSIYKAGIMYKKAGVILSEISPCDEIQQNLFDDVENRPERAELSVAMDKINLKYGLKSVSLAVEDSGAQEWKVKCEKRSGNYLTDINDILIVKI